MNAAYGKDNHVYSIFIADYKTYSASFYAYEIYATVAPGVDRIFPSASYLYIDNYFYNPREYFYNVGQKGSGVDANLENVIKNTILAYETSSTCYCYSSETTNIAKALTSFDRIVGA